MAKKKYPLPQKTSWAVQEAAEMLAWLDHTLNHDDLDFEATICTHLKQSQQKNCTLVQVNNKLRGLWNSRGANSELPGKRTWRDDLFTHGSSCLPGLNIDEKPAVQAAIERLEENYANRRQTRSVSRLTTARLPESSQTPRSVATRSKPRTSKYRSSIDSLTPSRVKRESDSIEKSPSKKGAPSKRQRKDTESELESPSRNNGYSESTRQEDSPMRPNHNFLGTVSSSTLEIGDTEEEGINAKSVISKSLRSFHGNSESRNNSIELHAGDRPSISPETFHGITNAEQSDLIAENRHLQEHLVNKETELYECKVTCEELKNRVDFLDSVQKQRDIHGGAPIGELIEQKDTIIKKLKRELIDRQTLGTFTELLSDSRDSFGDTEILNGFLYIYSESKGTTDQDVITDQFRIPSLDEHDNLRLLVCNGLGLDPQATHTIQNSQVDVSSLSFQAIVRALTTSAFRDWIFETDFPVFDDMQSKVLVKYRDHLANQDGPKALRNLDLAAHRSLIQDRHFRTCTIRQRAEALTIKLSQTLSPLFDREIEDPQESSWDGFATWGQKRNEWRKRRDHLKDMFDRALQLKADSVLNIEDYEMVIYPPGTIFDKNTMTVETQNGMVDLFRDHSGRKIKLCIDAAIFSYPRKPLNDLTPVSKAITPSKNFVRKEPRDRVGIRPVVKAVVVLRDDLLEDSGNRTTK